MTYNSLDPSARGGRREQALKHWNLLGDVEHRVCRLDLFNRALASSIITAVGGGGTVPTSMSLAACRGTKVDTDVKIELPVL